MAAPSRAAGQDPADPAPSHEAQTDIAARIAQLSEASESEREALLADLRTRGPAVARAALVDLAAARPDVRAQRAWLVLETGGRGAVTAAIAALDDPDSTTRGCLIAFLARAELGDAALADRIGALASHGSDDGDLTVRQRALVGLADLGRREALDALDAVIDRAGARERLQAARLLAQKPGARDIVARRVTRAFDASSASSSSSASSASSASSSGVLQLSGDELAPLLVGYARNLADAPQGGLSAIERAPLVCALRHADPRVARAGRLAFAEFLRRIVQTGDAQRCAASLSGFEAQGLDPRVTRYQRARAALVLGDDAAAARSEALSLLDAVGPGPEREARSWRARALQMIALAEIAAGTPAAALTTLDAETAILDGLLAERADRQSKSRRDDHEVCLRQRVVAEITRAVCVLAAQSELDPAAPLGATAPDHAVLAHVRAAHALELELALHRWSSDVDGSGGWDATLSDEQSPSTTFLDNPHFPAWPSARSFALRVELGRALASVDPTGVPGFDPWPGLAPEVSNAALDPRRRALMRAIQYAQFDALSQEQSRLEREMFERAAGDPGDVDPALLQKIEEIRLTLRDFGQAFARDDGEVPFLKPTFPSSWALWLARDLANEGLNDEARAIATRMKDDLESAGMSQRYVGGLELVAEIEMVIGSSQTQDGDPLRAEVELSKAVERLEAIESLLRERGVGLDGLVRVRMLRRSALVSLAVNANVKQHDVAKAERYFERAYEIAQDDFMRVLRACYRARAGHADEARALLREVTPGPGTHYNMACTFALLGDKTLALDFLRREFEENRQSPRAVQKQREWARTDPDLAALRTEAQFRALVGLP